MTTIKVLPMVTKPEGVIPCSYCGVVSIMTICDIVHLCDKHTEQFLEDAEAHISSFLFDKENH